MTTTSTTAHTPAAQTAAPAQTTAQQRAQGGTAAPADLFASLLNLVSDTHLAPEAATPVTEARALPKAT